MDAREPPGRVADAREKAGLRAGGAGSLEGGFARVGEMVAGTRRTARRRTMRTFSLAQEARKKSRKDLTGGSEIPTIRCAVSVMFVQGTVNSPIRTDGNPDAAGSDRSPGRTWNAAKDAHVVSEGLY